MPQTIHFRSNRPMCPFIFEFLNLLGDVKSFERFHGLIKLEIDCLPGTGLGRTVEMNRRAVFVAWFFRRLFPLIISGMLPAAGNSSEAEAILTIIDKAYTLPAVDLKLNVPYDMFIWEVRSISEPVRGPMGSNLQRWISSRLERSLDLLKGIRNLSDRDYSKFHSVEALVDRRSKEDVSYPAFMLIKEIVDNIDDRRTALDFLHLCLGIADHLMDITR